MTETEVRLSLSADDASLDTVHDAVADLLGRHAVGGRDRARFETGVIEVLGNIVEHAFSPHDTADATTTGAGPTGRRLLEVLLRVDADRLLAVLGDNGLPAALDLSTVVMPTDVDAESGRGLALALAAVDELHYERVGDRNTWTLACRRE